MAIAPLTPAQLAADAATRAAQTKALATQQAAYNTALAKAAGMWTAAENRWIGDPRQHVANPNNPPGAAGGGLALVDLPGELGAILRRLTGR